MKALKPCLSLLAMALIGTLAGCSTTSTKAADVSNLIRTSLDQAGVKDVSASQDRDNGVVSLTGHVNVDAEKTQVQSIVQAIVVGQVVSNQVAVVPADARSDAMAMNSDLDKGIEKNLDAALIDAQLHDHVKYAVKNHVVTLTGDVDSRSKRSRAEAVASEVLNVQQVVNELQVKAQKATSSN
jgi:osmotically-inducible protein OsmY